MKNMLDKTGSNQYKQKRSIQAKGIHGGVKSKTFLSIIIIILFFAIIEAPIVTFGKSQEIVAKSLFTSKVWAMRKTKFVMPPLAPEPERQRNIELIQTIFGSDADQAIKVFTCESGLRTLAMNTHNTDGFPDVGVAQIHVTDRSAFTVEEMQNAVANIYRAKAMFDDRSWSPWDSSKVCWGN